MKERPILFSAPMIRALLAGTKKQTRCTIKGEPDLVRWSPIAISGVSGWEDEHGRPIRCPYGHLGDRLWVREKWRIGAWDADRGMFALDYCDGPRKEWLLPMATAVEEANEVFERLWIECSDELDAKGATHDADGQYSWRPGESPLRWRPSIHMPRWASRILLEITDVRVERLQDISEEDAVAEGGPVDHPNGTARGWFEQLWEKLNGAGSWDANPWVWVIEFKRIEEAACKP
ncbi:hypothetical protein CBW21_22155 [Chromobacterium violaceum]|uniref:Morphogenetic protein n=1 Tax=Chromobacterium violaceum TaxID=536 RepID=A0A202B2Y6_CHRVL|nr:hypothetical protein CBW21_22155 [Chromobacterium violaceum]